MPGTNLQIKDGNGVLQNLQSGAGTGASGTPLIGNVANTVGTQADAAATGLGTFSLVALIKYGIAQLLSLVTGVNVANVGGTALALGPNVSANSVPTVIASDNVVTVATQGITYVQEDDPSGSSGTISVADSASATVTNASGQTIITGTPTSNSFVSSNFSGFSSFTVQISGTFSATLVFERSVNGGTTWTSQALELIGLGTVISSLTESDNRPTILRGSAGGLTNVRIRCTVYTSGTIQVHIQPSVGVANVPVGQFGGPWTQNLTQIGGVSLSLGQAASASSIPVVLPAAQITTLSAPILGAGTAVIGVVGSPDAVIQVNPTISTSAYVVGYSMGGKLTLTNAFRTTTGIIESVTITDFSNQKSPMTILFFKSNPAGSYGDHAAVSLTAADLLLCCGKVTISASNYDTVGTVAIAMVGGIGLEVFASSGTTLYALVIAQGTPTYVNTTDLQFTFGILQS